MAAIESTGTADAGEDPAKSRESKIKKYLHQFDRLIIGVTGAALAATLLYGLAAGPALPAPQVQTTERREQSPPPTRAKAPTVAPANTVPGNVPAGNSAGGNTLESTSPQSNAVVANRVAEEEDVAENDVARPSRLAATAPTSGVVARFTTALIALAIAMAALALGTFVGFLFGLPRTLTSGEARGEARSNEALAATNENREGVQSSSVATRSSAGVSGGVAVNTNLEQISDWLTKIIVGVGLTKLETLPGALERFGDKVDPYFSVGGKVFGIGGGLFFLIAGFFLAYVGTRVKLSLVFVGSQRDNSVTADMETAEVVLSSQTSAVDTSSLALQPSDDLKKADADILRRPLKDLQTAEERAAYANAAARQGRGELALDIMTDLVRERPNDEKILSDYAGLLALLGDERVDDVLSTIRTTAPAAEAEAQDKVNIAVLRSGLYDGGYEASIDAGEALLSRPIADRDPWIHLWLACAYGQKHANLKAQPAAKPRELAVLRDKAVAEIRRTVLIHPGLKGFVATLYDPAKLNGQDDDLQTFFRNTEIDALLQG